MDNIEGRIKELIDGYNNMIDISEDLAMKSDSVSAMLFDLVQREAQVKQDKLSEIAKFMGYQNYKALVKHI